MIIRAYCSIGYFNADHEEDFEIPDEELRGKTTDEIDSYIYDEYVTPWANEYLDIGYETMEE